MPPISRHAYLVRESTAWAAFVPVVGGFIKTHWCVVICPCERCGARPGQPCEGRNGPHAQTHVVRRAAGQRAKRKPKVIEQLRRALPTVALALEELALLEGI